MESALLRQLIALRANGDATWRSDLLETSRRAASGVARM